VERAILSGVRGLAAPWADGVFLGSHWAGSLDFCAILVAGMTLWHLARGERVEAALWIGLGISTLLLDSGLKALFERPRPRLWPWPFEIPPPAYGFPSGHALAAATFYPLLAWEAARRRPAWARPAWTLAAAAAFWIGFGRLYLGVHWPTDVLAGWALGAAQTGTALRWFPRR